MSRRQLFRTALGSLAVAGLGVEALGGTRVAIAADRRPRVPTLRMQQDAPDTVVVQWNRAALAAIRATHLGPPMVARALAVLHTCIYDAWALYAPAALPTSAVAALRQPAVAATAANKWQRSALRPMPRSATSSRASRPPSPAGSTPAPKRADA